MATAVKGTTINIRSDEDTKKSFSELCNKLGLSVSSALNMVMKSSVRNRELPVSLISINKPIAIDDLSDKELLSSIKKARQEIADGKGIPAEEVQRYLRSYVNEEI